MKNPLLPVILGLVTIFQITGCDTKIKTAAPYKSITMVYGLLDVGDTAHYVRIQKAFLSQDISAYDMAKVPDSSFYLNLDVTVKEMIPNTNVVHNTFTLQKVNMNNEGYQKDSGVFFTDPSYAYKFKNTLSPAYRYRLVIHNPQTGETDSSQTVLLSEATNGDGGFIVSLFNVANNTINFGQTPNPVNFYTIAGSVPDSTLLVQVFLRFKWVDKNIVTGAETDQYYDWNYGNTTLSSPAPIATSGFAVSNEQGVFITTLKQALGTPPANVQRYLDSPDIYIYAAPSSLYNYQVATLQAGLGITGSSIQPLFTNISGNNAYGIFSSRAVRYKQNIGFQGPAFNYIVNNAGLQGTGLQSTVADH